MARIDELRLMAKVAGMYHRQGMRQTAICKRLNIHQSTVSRMLHRAEREGIVRITVSLPPGTHTEIEESLQTRFGLDEAVVVDCLDDEDQIAHDLGAAAAFYLQTTLKTGDVIGISSWSAALLAMVNALHPSQKWQNTRVVQILGGVGDPGAEVHATQMTTRLAEVIGAEVTLLPAPGVVGSRQARDVLLQDRFVREALGMFSSVTLALVGIGATEPSRGLASSGNVFSRQELHRLAERGAVGDVCLRFFDAAGRPVVTELNDRVISMELDQMHAVRRVVGVAGGRRKVQAIGGALMGGLVNVVITDLQCAERLLAEPAPAPAAVGARASNRDGRKS